MSQQNAIEVEPRQSWFTILEKDVFEDERLSGPDLLVYWCLCYHADQGGKCWPMLSTICKEARCSKPTVIKSLNRLVELGYIEKRSRKHPTNQRQLVNVYRVPIRVKMSTTGRVKMSTSNDTNVSNKTQNDDVDTDVRRLFSTFKISPTDQQKHLNQHGAEKVLRQLQYMERQNTKRRISDPGAYLQSALSYDYAAKETPESTPTEESFHEAKRAKEKREALSRKKLEEEARRDKKSGIPPSAQEAMDRILGRTEASYNPQNVRSENELQPVS